MWVLGGFRSESRPWGDDLWWLTWFDHQSPSMMTSSSVPQATFARLLSTLTDGLPALDEVLAGQAQLPSPLCSDRAGYRCC